MEHVDRLSTIPQHEPSDRTLPDRRRGLYLLCLVPLMLVVGCATVSYNTVRQALVLQAALVDMPNVRAWGDTYSPVLQRSLVESIHQAQAIDPRVWSMPPATSTSWHCPGWSQRRLRCRTAEWVDGGRHPTGVQAGYRHQHGRPHRAVRLSWRGLRCYPTGVLYDDQHKGHLHRTILCHHTV